MDNINDKNIKRITFVVTEGEVRVSGHRGRQGEVEAMSAQRFVFVHGADGLDHLGTSKVNATMFSDTTWEANVVFIDTRDQANGKKT